MSRIGKATVVLRPGVGPETTIELDGVEYKHTATAVVVRGDVHTFPSVELDLGVRLADLRIDGTIDVDERTHALLVALGWTPPAGEP